MVCIAIAATTLSAQQRPSPQEAEALLRSSPDLAAQARSRLRDSGLTPDQVRARLRAEGYPEEVVIAILGHANETGVPRETSLARTLFAVDELCGFLSAVAYVRPSKKIADVDVSSVK